MQSEPQKLRRSKEGTRRCGEPLRVLGSKKLQRLGAGGCLRLARPPHPRRHSAAGVTGVVILTTDACSPEPRGWVAHGGV